MERPERRTYPRASCALRVSFRPTLVGSVGVIRNLSLGGGFIETGRRYEVGDTVELGLSLPGDERERVIVAVVRWVREEGPRGIGVEFIRAIPNDLVSMQKYIEFQARDTQVLERPEGDG